MGEKLDYVVDELFRMSKRGMSDFLKADVDGYDLDFHQASELGALNSIRKITTDRTGKITIELYDQLEILQILAKLDYSSSSDSATTNFTLDNVVKSLLKVDKESYADDE